MTEPTDTLRREVEILLDTYEWPADGELFGHATEVAVKLVRRWGHVKDCNCHEEEGIINFTYTDPHCAPKETEEIEEADHE